MRQLTKTQVVMSLMSLVTIITCFYITKDVVVPIIAISAVNFMAVIVADFLNDVVARLSVAVTAGISIIAAIVGIGAINVGIFFAVVIVMIFAVLFASAVDKLKVLSLYWKALISLIAQASIIFTAIYFYSNLGHYLPRHVF